MKEKGNISKLLKVGTAVHNIMIFLHSSVCSNVSAVFNSTCQL
jgi:hypothetical protein